MKFYLAVILLLVAPLSACTTKPSETWLFLVYLDGDNDLAASNRQDMEEMRLGANNAAIRLLVQFDQPNGIPAKRYEITNGEIRELENIGEVDMADGQTLTDFLLWAKTQVTDTPQHTVLILSDHGNGWDQTLGPSPANKIRPYSLFEDYDANKKRTPALHNHLVRDAVAKAEWSLDILGLDASIMGTIEAIYEFADLAPIVISSQEVGFADGWNYQRLLGDLSDNSAIDNETFATMVVNSYRDDFELDRYPAGIESRDQLYGIAAHRSAEIKSLTQAVATQSETWRTELADSDKRDALITTLKNARTEAQHIDFYNQPFVYVDLADLFVKTGNTDIPDLLEQSTIAAYHGKDRPNAHGLSIVFFQLPDAWNLTFDSNYKNWDAATQTGNKGKFINETSWDEMLYAYYKYAFPVCFDENGPKAAATC